MLNKEDPVGVVHQRRPNVLIISDDFGRQKDLGILRAVQRFRDSGMKIVALFQEEESAEKYSALYDAALTPPWKTADMREIISKSFINMRGDLPTFVVSAEDSDDDE